MKKKIDKRQLDLISYIEQVASRQKESLHRSSSSGKESTDLAIRSIISDSLKLTPLSRYEVASRMSEILGREITKAQLDAWSAESKGNHRFPIVYTAAFCEAVESKALIVYVVDLCGGYYIEGTEALDLELGRIEREEKELRDRKRALRALHKDMKRTKP